jgi:outer membrane immunogenic protein
MVGRVLTIAALAAAALAGARAALAAEDARKAPAPVFTWTGLYAGANFGHAWGGNRAIELGSANLLDLTAIGFGPASAAGASGVAHARLTGLFAGGQIGYNWQFAEQFVLGVEADIQGAGE